MKTYRFCLGAGLLFAAGCGSGNLNNAVNPDDIDEIRLYATDNFQSENLELQQVYDTNEDIAAWAGIINSADQVDGMVDIAAPDYEIALIGEEDTDPYFLWYSEDSASLMDSADTHTLYSITEDGKETLSELMEESG
ncbi:hypothetical protein [Alkalicoccus urumqiensis]|uniref:YhfM-like domain-containing protein n=1 Tax=Alkalicoccus urumqiensis TaxID=1548213 RepID=A0A2P6MJJ4_ALKUR|nr:hypothetical protein [Alkalicoccus urumqiensis]PRO66440.1 hypothetical protein C6I21_03620 [Alkalicoccus urumqiensis]